MPRPHPGERKEDFINRAIQVFYNEGFDHDAAVGRAYGFWRSYKKRSK